MDTPMVNTQIPWINNIIKIIDFLRLAFARLGTDRLPIKPHQPGIDERNPASVGLIPFNSNVLGSQRPKP